MPPAVLLGASSISYLATLEPKLLLSVTPCIQRPLQPAAPAAALLKAMLKNSNVADRRQNNSQAAAVDS